MKKLYITFLLLICLFPSLVQALATNFEMDKYMNIYIFSNSEEEIKEEKAYIENLEINDLELRINNYNIEEHKDLYNKVKEELKIKTNKLPLTIIGSNYLIGFNENKITKMINTYNEEDNYCDLTNKIINNEDTSNCLKENKNIYKDNNNKLIILSVVVLVSAAGVMFYKFEVNKN